MKPKFATNLVLVTILSLACPSIMYAEDSGSPVRGIEVRGNKAVSSLTVLAKIKTQVGEPISSTVLNEDLKRLYGLGYFSDVRIEQEPVKDGIKVVFLVVEKPVLAEIKIEGNKKVGREDIRKEMKSAIGDFIDQKRVRDDIEAIRRIYEKKGFSEAKISDSLDVNSGTGQATFRVIIDEGRKLRIQDIQVIGNKSINAGEIQKVMKTKKSSFWGWFHSGYIKEEDLADDVERIKALYDENGFSDAEISTEIGSMPNSDDAVLKITVNEGRKYMVGDIKLNGNAILKNEEIHKVVKMGSGKPFSRRGLRMDVSNIQDLYFERGYLSSQIRSESLYNDSTQKVDLNYFITENELTYVGKVRIQGNTKTKDIVIRRELRAYPGESFSGAKLKRSKERLYNLGYFEDVRFDTEPGALPNTRDLVVTVKETKTGEFSFGGGYSSVDALIGFVQLKQKNFDWQNWQTFTGAGQDMNLRVEFGSTRKNYELSFTEPWVFGYPYSFGFDLYQREYDKDGNTGYYYDLRKTGGQLRLGKEFNEYDKGLLSYRLEEVEISNIPDDASQALRDEAGTNTTGTIALTLTHDERDNIFNPTKGFLLTGTGELAGMGGNRDFWRLYGTGSTYVKHFEELVLEIKGRIGFADSYGDTAEVPIYERYFSGGGNTIRGYRERRIGPRDPGNQDPVGGDSYWIVNLEETFPIVPDLVKSAVFFDMGNVSEDTWDIGKGGVYCGVGAGVRVKTPIGPVKLDMGYPLKDIEGEEKELRFYFSVSQGF